jgi:hypothetical protein
VYSLIVLYKRWKFGWNQSLKKDTLLFRPQHVLSVSRLPFERVNETAHHALPARGLQCVQVWSKLVSKEVHFTFEAETVFPILPPIGAGWLKHHTLSACPGAFKECKFGRNLSVMNVTLLLQLKQFFVTITPAVAAGWLRAHMWNSRPGGFKQCTFRLHRTVMKGTFLGETETIFPPYLACHCNALTETGRYAILSHALKAVEVWSKSVSNVGRPTGQNEGFPPYTASYFSGGGGDWDSTPCTPYPCSTTGASLFENGQYQR